MTIWYLRDMIRRFDKNSIPFREDLIFDWSCVPKGQPISLEIGCGNGEYAIKYAASHPSEFLIAIERTSTKFQAFQKKLNGLEEPAKNLFALQADAIHWAAHNLETGPLLDQIFLLYPNPYPKEKQANLRFANMPFTGFLVRHLRPGGRLVLATNMPFYYEEAKQKFPSNWHLDIHEDRTLNATWPPRTAFERKYMERGEACFNLIFSKPK